MGMAQYIILEVEDNDTAVALIKKLRAVRKINVLAMFTKATELCECPIRSPKSMLGSKFRWWLCPQCKKPKSGTSQMLVRNRLVKHDDNRDFHIRLNVTWRRDNEGGIHTVQSGEEINHGWS